MRALAIHTAKECGTDLGPDYSFGWGLLDAHAAASAIIEDTTKPYTILENTLSEGQSATYTVYADGMETRQIRVPRVSSSATRASTAVCCCA